MRMVLKIGKMWRCCFQENVKLSGNSFPLQLVRVKFLLLMYHKFLLCQHTVKSRKEYIKEFTREWVNTKI